MSFIAHTTGTTLFLEKLQDPTCSIGDLLVGIGLGRVATPDVLESPTQRWEWFANLLTDPDWGISTTLPTVRDLCDRIADLYRHIAPHPPRPCGEHWTSVAVDIAAARRHRHGPGETEALDLLDELTLDGIDRDHGDDVAGFEALLGYIGTLRAVRGADARDTLIWAAEQATHQASRAE